MGDEHKPVFTGLRPRELLKALLSERYGNKLSVLARELGIQDRRTVKEWLERDVHIQPSKMQGIIECALRKRVEVTRFCDGPPLWNVKDSIDEIGKREPGPLPDQLPEFPNAPYPFLGYTLNSRFGAAPSSITLNPMIMRWLFFHGCDTVVFKTVLSHERWPHETANNIFYGSLDGKFLDATFENSKLRVQIPSQGLHASRCGLLKRYGIYSPPPAVWVAAFKTAKDYATKGQLLILSVSGTAKR